MKLILEFIEKMLYFILWLLCNNFIFTIDIRVCYSIKKLKFDLEFADKNS